MISLSRIYSQRAVYLLFLSIFTLLWEVMLAAKAYAGDRADYTYYLPTGPCAVDFAATECEESRRILRSIAADQSDAVKRLIEHGSRTRAAVGYLTFGSLVLMGRTQYYGLLRAHLSRPGSTHIGFIDDLGLRRSGASRPRIPVVKLQSLGIDPKSENAYVPDIFIAVMMGDAEAYRLLVARYQIRPEYLQDNQGNGLGHYIAVFATSDFLRAIDPLLPDPRGVDTPNNNGVTAADLYQERSELHSFQQRPDLSAVGHWLRYEERPVQLALAN